jgi:hypothetical protein
VRILIENAFGTSRAGGGGGRGGKAVVCSHFSEHLPKSTYNLREATYNIVG